MSVEDATVKAVDSRSLSSGSTKVRGLMVTTRVVIQMKDSVRAASTMDRSARLHLLRSWQWAGSSIARGCTWERSYVNAVGKPGGERR